jgi:hypothetical protein
MFFLFCFFYLLYFVISFWFSPGTPGTPASSTTKTGPGRHDIAEILLKVALNTINQIISFLFYFPLFSLPR